MQHFTTVSTHSKKHSMTDEHAFSRKELAKHLGIGYSTLRKYEKDFADFLSVAGGVMGDNTPVTYGDEDARVLATVVRLRAQRLTLDAIRSRLPDELAQTPQPLLADDFAPEDATAATNALIPMAQHVALAGKLASVEGALAAVEDERDYLRGKLDEAQQARLDAAQEVARLAAQVDMLRAQLDEKDDESEGAPRWWQRIFGRKE